MKCLGLIFCFFLFFNCTKKTAASQKATPHTNLENVKNSAVKIDSVTVSDSLLLGKTLTASFKMTLLQFNNIKNKALLDSIYAPEMIRATAYTANNLRAEANKKMNNFFAESRESLIDWTPDFAQTWTQNSSMRVFSLRNDLLTIRYIGDGFTGGAHGYYYEKYKVFDLRSGETLQLTDVIADQNPHLWHRILSDNFLKNDLGRGQSDMLLVQKIPLNNNFYFDGDHLYFLYNQYEIAAYAAGPVLIKIPFTDVKPLLTEAFKKRVGLQ